MAKTSTAQLSLFGIMEEQRRQRAEETIPVLLHAGDIVYLLYKADIDRHCKECIVELICSGKWKPTSAEDEEENT